jgi:hypothetical protein
MLDGDKNTAVRKVIIIRSSTRPSHRERERNDIAEGSRDLNQIPGERYNYWPFGQDFDHPSVFELVSERA